MKKIYLIAAMLVSMVANAQYFQDFYGTALNDEPRRGLFTQINAVGHVVAGFQTNGTDLLVTRTDQNGAFPLLPNYFNNSYQITTLAGVVLDVGWVDMLECPAFGGLPIGYTIVGEYLDPAGILPSGIFHLRLDANGNVLLIQNFAFMATPVFAPANLRVRAMSAVGNGADFYVTGTVQNANTGEDNFYVIRMNHNGLLMWSFVYDIPGYMFDHSFDVIASPYLPVGIQEVVVAGACAFPMAYDAFFVRLNALTGAVLGGNTYANPVPGFSALDGFSSIDISNDPLPAVGFVMGGITCPGPDEDGLLMKVDAMGNILWQNSYDYAAVGGNHNAFWDVRERLNTFGTYEYYTGGYSFGGFFGGGDMVVMKMNNAGVGVGEFTYGGNQNDYGARLDLSDGANPGIYAYGSSTGIGGLGLGGSDMYIVKAYFNGVSGCNENLATQTTNPSIMIPTPITPLNFSRAIRTSLLATKNTILDVTLCYNPAIPGGSNARIAPAEPKGEKEAIVSPNPMQQGTSVATVAVEADAAATVQVAIYDMLGRSYYSSPFTLAKGNNQLPLDISKTNMAAGMYTIKITGDGIAKNILLLVK